ncbi:MAG: L-seryl-tRNA(Sec) selenium transferase [Candidatus Handelsmanbacteria bacterium]|nr:L-seryl-tRNA(Sec) selenium transferase [Candidatus Handelsmanbacteria bacterium]
MSPSLRLLPSVEQVLGTPAARELLARCRREYVAGLARQALARLRSALVQGQAGESRQALLGRAEVLLVSLYSEACQPGLARAINATGVILHTGLGRAPLAPAARAAIAEAAEHYCALELDLEAGGRGARLDHVRGLLAELSGAEWGLVVNNNAAAVLLCLNTLARGREVLVSRGELVEIGGSFRIPDIIAASGAQLREVGTTNRTHLRDYAEALSPQTGLLLRVQPSNYRVQGFTARVETSELAELARKGGVPLVHDLGGGVLEDLSQWGLPREPVVRRELEVGAELVTFSGDKVLGGPQCGIIVGRRALAEPMERNPLMRALRCDKLVMAGLEASLRLFRLAPGILPQVHPVMGMLCEQVGQVEERARALIAALPVGVAAALCPAIEASAAQIGSGALPLEELASRAVVLSPRSVSAEELARRLRAERPPVVGRIQRGRLLLDLRTVREDEVEGVAAALIRAAGVGA